MSEIEKLKARVKLLETGLNNLINVAECCDNWESFPEVELEYARDILNDEA